MMILIKIKGPIINNVIYEFSSKTGVLCFVGFFVPLTKFENYKIRVDKRLRIEFPSF
jgi:hypothetical protein